MLDSRPKGSNPVPARGHHVVIPISVLSTVTASIDGRAFYVGLRKIAVFQAGRYRKTGSKSLEKDTVYRA